MVERYVDAINSGFISITSAWDHIMRQECSRAFEESQKYYKNAR